MTGEADRLTRMEVQIEQHQRMHEETHNALNRLADGMTVMAEGIGKIASFQAAHESQREDDKETFARAFGEIGEVRKEVKEYKERQLEKELAAYRGIVWKVLALVALVIASVIAGHFSAHLI